MRRVLRASTPWHPGYPFKPRGGRARKVASVLTLASLVTLIGGYYYVTDSRRVKSFSEAYLTELVGGPVRVGRARLSIFEGLRLERVTVDVDGRKLPDSTLLTAQQLRVSFPWAKLIRGDLSEATITAVEPHLTLITDARTGEMNFQRLRRAAGTTRPDRDDTAPLGRLQLPQLLLRNARISTGELRDGKVHLRLPWTVEGSLTPDPLNPDRVNLAVTARGPTESAGPSLTGWANVTTGQVSARLRDINLDTGMEGLLPGPVREWWRRHEIGGSIEIPEITVDPLDKTGKRDFRVVANFTGGRLSLRPEELRPRDAEPLPPGLPSIRFDDVRGKLTFTRQGIELSSMSLVHEGNTLQVSGRTEGYSFQTAPMEVTLRCDRLVIPEKPAVVPSLPPEAREVYDRFIPSGEGKMAFSFRRDAQGLFAIDGRLDITRGRMAFERFPFMCHDVTGAIVVTSVEPGKTRLEAVDIRGRGRPGGPNENADLRVSGRMFPLESGSEVDFDVAGTNITADDELIAAMPPNVQKALRSFDARTDGSDPKYPRFGGSFTCKVYRYPGPVSRWLWPIDIKVEHGNGRFAEFPYPLENLTGNVVIESGYVRLNHMTTRRGDATLDVDGTVTWRDQPDGKNLYDLKLTAANVPADDDLLSAVPADKRDWIRRLGVTGTLDLTGTVTGLDARYDLNLKLRDGALKPNGGTWVAEGLAATLRLDPDILTVSEASARRGGSVISASAVCVLRGDKAGVTLDLSAKALPLDPDLRGALPEDQRGAWDAVKPEGLADVSIALRPGNAIRIDITPLGVAVTPSVMPVRLTDVRGRVIIDSGMVEMTDMTASRGDARLTLSGTGSTSPRGAWDVKLRATNVLADDELRAAMPSSLRDTLTSLDLKGTADLDVRKLAFTPGLESPTKGKSRKPAAHSTGASPGSTGTGGAGASADFDVTLTPKDLTASLGVPLRATSGAVTLAGTLRDDRLSTLTGSILLSTGDMASRPFRNLSTTLAKRDGTPGIALDSLSGTLADGELAGRAAVVFPDDAPTRYAMELLLRNADVRLLAGAAADPATLTASPVSGRLSASLALEGSVDNAATRKGRGDINVTGEQMARIPILLGLVQVANLSLPGGTSFNNATARYAIEGPRVTFEQLAIRSPGLEMTGHGRIDLDQRDVRLTLWTAPPNLPRIPVWSDLTDQARRELLQIQVRGTIDDPRIGASSFDSFTTTVETVFKSTGRTPEKPATRK